MDEPRMEHGCRKRTIYKEVMKTGKEKENVHTDGEGKLNRRKWREGRLAAKEHRERKRKRDANFAN